MNANPIPFKILTYNIHKGFTSGNLQLVIEQIRKGIRETDAEIVFLQEVQGRHSGHAQSEANWPTQPQFEYLADSVWSHYAYGQNAIYEEGHHGNAILSKYPIVSWDNSDISTNSLEKRGLIHAKILVSHDQSKSEKYLHLFCAHLNLFEKSRMKQIKRIGNIIKERTTPQDTVILAGDFNDWTHQVSAYFIKEMGLQEAFRFLKLKPPKTFPSFFPLLSLDRIYFRGLSCQQANTLEGKIWRKLSDHLPLLAEFWIQNDQP